MASSHPARMASNRLAARGRHLAVVAVYFNAQSTGAANRAASAAGRAASAAEEQTKIQRQLRIDAAEPYVWVDVRPDSETGTLLNLVIGNSGPTVATNVRITVDPPLPTIDQLAGRAEAAQGRLADGISSFAPGRLLLAACSPGLSARGST